jgi:excisionase family DNA binding protein
LTFTVNEVAKDLRVTVGTVYILIANKKLGCFKVGNRFRIPEEALKKFKEDSQNEIMSQVHVETEA